ncbi:hybrid sensor histidine kinase/response regulator [haloarchaeon 3A1-DGR]|nr:hybrid sensor histidine kinase/response regulator [haloarchaeon 3A1-DGR]
MAVNIDSPLDLLLIEDNPGDARLIERHLDRADSALVPPRVDLVHERSLSAGTDRIHDEEFDVLLLDLGLPESQGLETLSRVLDHTSELPIVVLTGLQSQETAVEAIKNGAQDFLRKDDVDDDTLSRSIRYAIERKDREIELRRRTEQLEVLNRIVRHDIQNDVTVIQGWTEMLRDHVDPAHEATIDRITDSTRHITDLTHTVEDFLAGFTADGEFTVEPVALAPILDDEIEKKRSVSPDATFHVDGELPNVQVHANRLLSSVFENVLSNAVTHSDRETPAVTVRAEVDETRAIVSIADDGPGVPDDRKREIFGKSEMGLDSPGSGIGLHLVYRLVDRYGGRVWVEDNDPRGAVFRIELRRAD